MQQIYDCLRNVIGLSDTNCNCWDSDKPVDFATLNASNSGLYLSQPDTIPVKITNTAADCEQGGVWDMLVTARDRGIKDVVAMFIELVQARLAETRTTFQDYVGTSSKNSFVIPSFDYQGIYFRPYYIKGGALVIDKVQLALTNITAPVDVDVFVYRGSDLTTSLGSTTVTLTTAGDFYEASFSTPVAIDLSTIRDDEDEKIFVVYELPSGARVVNNETEIGCGTCGGYAARLKRNPQLEWNCEINGFESDSIANLNTIRRASSYARGLRVNASFYCDWWSWLCDVATNLNTIVQVGGQKANLGMQLADAIQAASVARLAEAIKNSPNINRYGIVMDDKYWYSTINRNKRNAAQWIAFIADKLPHDVTDCLKCLDNGRLGKTRIF